jgi:hypothetical protein
MSFGRRLFLRGLIAFQNQEGTPFGGFQISAARRNRAAPTKERNGLELAPFVLSFDRLKQGNL